MRNSENIHNLFASEAKCFWRLFACDETRLSFCIDPRELTIGFLPLGNALICSGCTEEKDRDLMFID